MISSFDSIPWSGKKYGKWPCLDNWNQWHKYVTWPPLNGLIIRTGNITYMKTKGFDIMTDIKIVNVYW